MTANVFNKRRDTGIFNAAQVPAFALSARLREHRFMITKIQRIFWLTNDQLMYPCGEYCVRNRQRFGHQSELMQQTSIKFMTEKK